MSCIEASLAGLRMHLLGVRMFPSVTGYIMCLLSRTMGTTGLGLRDAEGSKSQLSLSGSPAFTLRCSVWSQRHQHCTTRIKQATTEVRTAIDHKAGVWKLSLGSFFIFPSFLIY